MEAHEELGSPTLGETVQAATSGSLPSNQEGSLLDALAQQREEQANTRSVDVPLPVGQNGIQLYVTYRLLDGEELSNIGRKVQQQFGRKQQYERQLYSSIDVLIEACEGFLVEIKGKKTPLTYGGVPIRGYSQQLAEALKFADKIDPNSPARSCVLGFFAGNVVAIQQHSLLLGRWMGDTSLDITKEFLEFQGNL